MKGLLIMRFWIKDIQRTLPVAFDNPNKGIANIIDIDKVYGRRGFINLYCQAMGYVMAESLDNGVIVRPAPLTKGVVETEDINRVAGCTTEFKKQLFCLLF